MSDAEMWVYPTVPMMKKARKDLGRVGALNEALMATGIDALFVLLEGGVVEFNGIGRVEIRRLEGTDDDHKHVYDGDSVFCAVCGKSRGARFNMSGVDYAYEDSLDALEGTDDE